MDFWRLTPSRIFLFLLISFIAGVAVRSFLVVPAPLILGVLLLGVTVIALGGTRRGKRFTVFGLLVVVFAFGIFRYADVHVSRPDLSGLYGKHIVVTGLVAQDPEVTARAQRLVVRVMGVNDAPISQEFLSLITVRRFPKYELGDELVISGIIEQPENFNGFDYAAYLAKDNIYSVIAFPEVKKVGSGKGNTLRIFLSRAKHAFEENIDQALPDPHAAFLKGLTVGERDSLPPDLVEDFTRTGTTHIVALSGYNITLVARFFIVVLLFCTLPFRVAFWVSSAGVILFVLLTGASPSVVRAGIMGILMLLASREGRVYRVGNALVFAAAVMIFVNPNILRFDAAFQLSFLAAVGLVYCSPHVYAWLDRMRTRIGFYIGYQKKLSTPEDRRMQERDAKQAWFSLQRIFAETLSAQCMVLPLLVYLFGRISIVSPIANLFILIAVPYAMVLGFLTGGFGFISSRLAQGFGAVAWIFLEYQIRVVAVLALLPFSSIEIGKWAVIPVVATYCFVFWKLKKAQKGLMREGGVASGR